MLVLSSLHGITDARGQRGKAEQVVLSVITVVPTRASKIIHLNMEDAYTGISKVLISDWARTKALLS